MRYFVIADDGAKYGPADIQTLNEWIRDGRILPSTLIEEEGSGARLAASSVAGLTFEERSATAPSQEYASPASNSNYWQNPPYANYGAAGVAGSTETTIAWVLGVVGALLCCCGGFLFSSAGVFFAWLGTRKGNPRAQQALVFNGVILVITLFFAALSWPAFKDSFAKTQEIMKQQGMDSPFSPPITPKTSNPIRL